MNSVMDLLSQFQVKFTQTERAHQRNLAEM